MLSKLLAHPLTKGLTPDDPRTTELRRRIIKEKAFLRKIYEEWYADLIAAIPAPNVCPGKILELGSGGGFLKELLPECITSEVFPCSGVDMILDGRKLPFADNSLRAIVMVDVFHHIPNVAEFLSEAQRTLTPSGVVAMWEPWNTPWGRFIYQYLHSEPFEPEAEKWEFPESGPLSGANGALPWMVFERDKHIFEQRFPQFAPHVQKLDYPFSYLISGGVSRRALVPGIFFSAHRKLERYLSYLKSTLSMFALILVYKKKLTPQLAPHTKYLEMAIHK